MTEVTGCLQGASAVVAGSSRGIGRAVAMTLAREGAHVFVNGRSAPEVDEVVAAIVAAGGRASGFVGSVADFDVAGELVARCAEVTGGIDVLVNCVGIAEPTGASILDLAFEAWQALIDAHLTSTFNTCRHAAPRMKARGHGAIVNTASHAFLGHYGGSGYPAGKGGTVSLTYAMAGELRDHGIRVNAVCPGARTRLSTGDEYEAHIESLHARGLLSDVARAASLAPPEAEHVGPLYAFLASDLARGLSGRVFSGVGGYVGVFEGPAESLVAYRDARKEGPWPVAALAERIRQATAFGGD